MKLGFCFDPEFQMVLVTSYLCVEIVWLTMSCASDMN